MKTRAVEPGNLTRQERFKIAAELFRGKGFRTCLMQGIASTLGIKKASIYHYISTKTDLLREISQTAMTMMAEAGKKIASSELPPEDKLKALILKHISLIHKYFDLFTVTLREITTTNAASFWDDMVGRRDR